MCRGLHFPPEVEWWRGLLEYIRPLLATLVLYPKREACLTFCETMKNKQIVFMILVIRCSPATLHLVTYKWQLHFL